MIENINNTPQDSGQGDNLYVATTKINNNFDYIQGILNDVLTTGSTISISQVSGLQAALNSINNELANIPTILQDIVDINTAITSINNTLNSQNISITQLQADIVDLQSQINLKVEEAPIDGLQYARQDGSWTIVSGGTGSQGLQSVLDINNEAEGTGIQLVNAISNPLQSTSLTYTGLNVTDANTSDVRSISVGPYEVNIMSNNSDTGVVMQTAFDKDGIALVNNVNQAVGRISNINNTESITLVFPDNLAGTYTIATVEDIPSTPTLQQVTDLGSTTTNSIDVQNLTVQSQTTIKNIGIGSAAGIIVEDGSGSNAISLFPTGEVKLNNSGNELTIGTDNIILNSYMYNYPTNSGTLALLSDVPSLNGYVPYTGASQNVILGNFDINTQGIKVTGTNGNGHLTMRWQASDPISQGNHTTFFADSLGDFKWKNDGGFYTTLKTSSNTANRTYTYPNASGTLALTSDILSSIMSLNSLTGSSQTLVTGSTGTNFNIVSSGSSHTFNLPTASATNRGALSSTDWNTFNNKQNNLRTFNTTQGIYYFEDFMGNQAGSVGAAYLGVVSLIAGNSTARSAGTTNRTNQQGIISHSTGTASTNFAGYAYGSSLYIGSGTISIETYATVETLSTVTERFMTYFGYAGGSSNYLNIPSGIFFSYDEGGVQFSAGAATPNWKCYTRATGGTVTVTTSSVVVNANQWYKLRIDINAAGTSVTFYINGTLVATHSTNIPAPTTAIAPVSIIHKTAGTTARTMLTDYFMYEETFTNPR